MKANTKTVNQSEANQATTVLGCVEAVTLCFDEQLVDIMAKVDTGAYSGALHVTDISLSKTDGVKTLSFSPLGKSELRRTTTEFVVRTVRSAHGHAVDRYLVPLRITVQGVEYEIVIGLADRQAMQFEMLIGRKFLSEHGMLVDVRRNDEYDFEKETLQ